MHRHSHARAARIAARQGFTLIEVMIAIAIVVILIGIVGFNVIGQLERGEEGSAKIQLDRIENALDTFRLDFGRYPTEDEGIEVLWNRDVLETDEEGDESDVWTAYLSDPVESDPWGNEWQYTDQTDDDSRDYELWSYGPDGEDGTEDDIRSWSDAEDGAGMGAAPAAP